MAFLDDDADLPLCIPQPAPQVLPAGGPPRLLGEDLPREDRSEPAGIITRDWFGPFLFASPTRFLRGRC
jgi:hypothetical protein